MWIARYSFLTDISMIVCVCVSLFLCPFTLGLLFFCMQCLKEALKLAEGEEDNELLVADCLLSLADSYQRVGNTLFAGR
jgi:hypothetical protein